MCPIEVRNIRIGEGIPKICLPIVGHTQYEITSQAMTIASLKPDIVEFRADWYDNVLERENLMEMLKLIRKLIGSIPLLFTFRRIEEGGVQKINTRDYGTLNRHAIKSGLVDMVDIEFMSGEKTVESIMETAHKNNVVVIISNHNFEKTPSRTDMINMMKKMIEAGADIPKLAVMPESNKDVLALLDVTDTIHEKYPDIPIITMSMGGKGIVSRISCEIFGSAVSFGSARKASAPGQMEAGDLLTVLRTVHRNLYENEN